MAKSPFSDKMPAAFEVPPEVREVAEKSLAQAREGVARALSAATEAVETMEQRAGEAQKQAQDIGRRSFSYAEQSMAAAFDLAEKLLKATKVEEVMQLQTEYVQKQFEGARAHMQETGEEIQRRTKAVAVEMVAEGTKMGEKARKLMEEGVEAVKKAATPKG